MGLWTCTVHAYIGESRYLFQSVSCSYTYLRDLDKKLWLDASCEPLVNDCYYLMVMLYTGGVRQKYKELLYKLKTFLASIFNRIQNYATSYSRTMWGSVGEFSSDPGLSSINMVYRSIKTIANRFSCFAFGVGPSRFIPKYSGDALKKNRPIAFISCRARSSAHKCGNFCTLT